MCVRVHVRVYTHVCVCVQVCVCVRMHVCAYVHEHYAQQHNTSLPCMAAKTLVTVCNCKTFYSTEMV